MLAVGTGILDLLDHPFMRHALLAGIPVAALSGLVGSFMVLRSQLFTGDALSHVAFAGALGALAVGFDPRLGLFVTTIAVAIVLGLLGNKGRADDVVIGTVFAWVLGLGVLALSIYTSSRSAGHNGTAGVNALFGSIFGVSAAQARLIGLIALVVILMLIAIARPLLFASLDEAVAAARGVPVRLLGITFLVIVGATAAEASQAVGSLLLLGLLAAPAGAARRLTDRAFIGLALSSGLAVAAMVIGLVISYLVPRTPPSFAILATSSAIFAATFLVRPPNRRPDPAHVRRQ